MYEICQRERHKLDGLTYLLPYNFFALVSSGRLLTFYLKYLSMTLYAVIYLVSLVSYLMQIYSGDIGLEWILGGILILLNILSTVASVSIFPNTNVSLHRSK